MSEAPTPQTPTGTAAAQSGTDDTNTDDSDDGGPGIETKRAGRRVSGSVEVLVTEAELIADGTELDNPAQPASAEVVDQVMARLEAADDDLRPAWAVVEDG